MPVRDAYPAIGGTPLVISPSLVSLRSRSRNARHGGPQQPKMNSASKGYGGSRSAIPWGQAVGRGRAGREARVFTDWAANS
jgi:hypothetical protein